MQSTMHSQNKKLQGKNGRVYHVFMDQLLGKGAFANVYMGVLEGSTKFKYAVKVVSRENLKKWGEKGKSNLESEITILSKISHRNIVKLEDFIQTGNNYYLIFEYCAGGDLQSYIKEFGPLDELTA
jgi:serine/threonine-protein kinase ULK/ATG1